LAIEGGQPIRERFLVFGEPVLGDEEIDEVVAALRSRWIGTGPRVQRFEEKFRERIGCSHALAVSSCTAALHLALLAAGVRPGDEVLVTALTFVASANVIVHCGATPVFVDIDAQTLNFDLHDLERKITRRTRAIVAVHFAGLPVDLPALQSLAGERGLSIVEDAAHAIGASIDGVRIGAGPNLTAFSFYANKNITTGEGGMLACSGMTGQTHDYLSAMRLHGLTNDAWRRYHSAALVHPEAIGAGFKYNMPDLLAALGLHQLDRLETFLSRREGTATRFRSELGDIAGIRFQSTPDHYGRLRHGLHLFVVVLEPGAFRVDRDTIVAALRAENIGAAIHYGSLPLQRFYREAHPEAHHKTQVANAIGDSILTLPLRPDFTSDDEHDVVDATRKVLSHFAAKR